MKYKQIKPEPQFRPIRITLETQEETDVLHALLGLAAGNYADDFTYKLYERLGDASDSIHQDYWTGTIYVKKG